MRPDDVFAGLAERPPVLHRVMAHREMALEVHLDHRVPFGLGDVEAHRVAQDAGVVHDDVEPAELVDRLLHERAPRRPRSRRCRRWRRPHRRRRRSRRPPGAPASCRCRRPRSRCRGRSRPPGRPRPRAITLTAIVGAKREKSIGALGVKALVLFVAMLLAASCLTLAVATPALVSHEVDPEAAASFRAQMAEPAPDVLPEQPRAMSVGDWLVGLVPVNVFSSAARGRNPSDPGVHGPVRARGQTPAAGGS